MTGQVTRGQADAVLAAVIVQWQATLEPLKLDDGTTLAPCYDRPTLVMGFYDGAPAIVWECGPPDWAYHADSGDPSEEDYVLAGDAGREFGVPFGAPEGREPLRLPAGVNVEPVYSYALGIYPA